MAVSTGLVGRALCRAALVLVPVCLGAQATPSATERTTLVGVVRDSAGRPVVGAEIRVASELVARTNEAGGFRAPSVPVGTSIISVRRMGYSPVSSTLTLRAGHTDSLVLALGVAATELEGVLVEEEALDRSHRFLPGFWDRRSKGFGSYMTRDEIEKRDAKDFADLVRMNPGVRVSTRNGRKFIGFARNFTNPNCPPQYIVDGIAIFQGSPDEFLPSDIEAIEMYSGPSTTPPQFVTTINGRTCGTIVIWSRVPG